MAGFIPYEDLTDEQKHVADVLTKKRDTIQDF